MNEIPLNLTQNEFVFLITMWIMSSGQISGDAALTHTAMLLLSDLVAEKNNEFLKLREKMETMSAKFAASSNSLSIPTQLKLALLISLMETLQQPNSQPAKPSKPVPTESLPDNLSDTFRDMFGKGFELD